MNSHVVWILLVLSLTVFSGQVFSSPPEPFREPPSGEQREKARKKIETLKMWRLTKLLNLDEKRAAKLFPIMNKYDRKIMSVMRNMRKDLKKLRNIVDTATADELNGLIKKLEHNRLRHQEIKQEEMQRFKEVLTIREMAKFIIFKHDFNREMRKIIAEVRGKRMRRHREKAGSPGYGETSEPFPDE